ncbi:unnamed protein product [Brassica rapa subsp. trilocularis]
MHSPIMINLTFLQVHLFFIPTTKPLQDPVSLVPFRRARQIIMNIISGFIVLLLQVS